MLKTTFRDNWPGKLFCESCKIEEPKTSIAIVDLGRTLSGEYESINVCLECYDTISAEIEREYIENA